MPLIAPQAIAKNILLEGDKCAPDLFVRADQLKVEQIVLNLLSNAVKFTPETGKVQRVVRRRRRET